MIDDKEIYRHLTFLGMTETVNWLRFSTKNVSRKTLKRIVELCFEMHFPDEFTEV